MPGKTEQEYTLETAYALFTLSPSANAWSMYDKRSGVTWGNTGSHKPWVMQQHIQNGEKSMTPLKLQSVEVDSPAGPSAPPGMADNRLICRFTLENGSDSGISLVFRLKEHILQVYILPDNTNYHVLQLFNSGLETCAADNGELLLPIRMGLLLQASAGEAFNKHLGTYDYEEGVHMAMAGLFKGGSALMVTWGDPYVALNVSHIDAGEEGVLRMNLEFIKTARSCELHCLGMGGIETVAAAYRQRAENLGYRVTWDDKLKTHPQAERLFGACNVKLWTALARRIDKDMVEQSVEVKWTFDEAARIAEHIKTDLEIDDVLFHLGGWTRYGYDCKHPDNMPANPECGGNAGLADCARRVQDCGYLFCLHDNYQDMYRDAPSWNEVYLQKNADGSPKMGGVWLGGQAYYTCAREAVKLAQRPENLPMVRDVVHPDLYFIDTTYAVGPQECFDPRHPLTKQQDIRWKIILSDYAREIFSMFGSECGREWAVPHADFFEGLASVAGRYYHHLDPKTLGGCVVPFFDMVFRDCIAVYGKYGYNPAAMAEQVLHHIAIGRTLYYHSLGSHLYWQIEEAPAKTPQSTSIPDAALFTRGDNGWAEGLCIWDRFMKNTQSVLGPLNKRTSQTLIAEYKFLDNERLVRQTTFENGVMCIVNGSEHEYDIESDLWGKVQLPPYGFLVDAGDFVAFHAATWQGKTYRTPPLFTMESLDGQPVTQSHRLSVYHGFGDVILPLWNRLFEVPRQAILER
jgi:hypothetical protein